MLWPVAGDGAVVADAPDTRIGAQPLMGSFVAAIDRPGDHDWYSLRGTAIGETTFDSVRIRVVSTESGCIASRPLFVLLRNPEGRWIRTYSISSDPISFPFPGLPGRYYLEVRAADSRCFALLYELDARIPPESENDGRVLGERRCVVSHSSS